MNQEKIRILGIAPYEGLKSVMQKMAADRNDIDLTVYVGDLQKGAELAQRNFHGNFDVIISRGGTAELIGSLTDLPVIEITLSVYDVLRAIKMAENFSSRYAIVGFPSITDSARLLCDLLQYRVEICTVHSAEEVEKNLLDLRGRGYRMILCDVIANTTAKRLGLNAILITSGSESIANTFDQAVKLCRSHSILREENRFLRDVIQNGKQKTVIFDDTGELFFSTLPATGYDSVIQTLKKESISCGEPQQSFKNIEGILYSIEGFSLPFYSRHYSVFFISPSAVPLAISKYGIQYQNRRDVENSFYNSFYNITGQPGNLQADIEQMIQTNLPIMITGEEGTGKGRVAGAIYTQGSLRHNALITIDFALMNDKTWGFLVNHYDSPFNDNNNTLYLKNIDALSQERQRQLLSLIIDMNLTRRNQLLFSAVCQQDGALSQVNIDFINKLSCLTIHLPPLRQRREEIPTLANLCLSSLNMSLAKEILGLENGAMERLITYDWPGNYTQFKRLLNKMMVITTMPYIQEDTVTRILEQEAPPAIPSTTIIPDLNRTLDDINQCIVHAVLEEVKGNRSAAAKRLGISRTTLWRFLKE